MAPGKILSVVGFTSTGKTHHFGSLNQQGDQQACRGVLNIFYNKLHGLGVASAIDFTPARSVIARLGDEQGGGRLGISLSIDLTKIVVQTAPVNKSIVYYDYPGHDHIMAYSIARDVGDAVLEEAEGEHRGNPRLAKYNKFLQKSSMKLRALIERPWYQGLGMYREELVDLFTFPASTILIKEDGHAIAKVRDLFNADTIKLFKCNENKETCNREINTILEGIYEEILAKEHINNIINHISYGGIHLPNAFNYIIFKLIIHFYEKLEKKVKESNIIEISNDKKKRIDKALGIIKNNVIPGLQETGEGNILININNDMTMLWDLLWLRLPISAIYTLLLIYGSAVSSDAIIIMHPATLELYEEKEGAKHRILARAEGELKSETAKTIETYHDKLKEILEKIRGGNCENINHNRLEEILEKIERENVTNIAREYSMSIVNYQSRLLGMLGVRGNGNILGLENNINYINNYNDLIKLCSQRKNLDQRRKDTVEILVNIYSTIQKALRLSYVKLTGNLLAVGGSRVNDSILRAIYAVRGGQRSDLPYVAIIASMLDEINGDELRRKILKDILDMLDIVHGRGGLVKSVDGYHVLKPLTDGNVLEWFKDRIVVVPGGMVRVNNECVNNPFSLLMSLLIYDVNVYLEEGRDLLSKFNELVVDRR